MENTINSPHVPSKAPLQKELTFCSIGAMHLVSNEKWGGGVMCQMVQLVMGLASMVYVHEFYYIYIYQTKAKDYENTMQQWALWLGGTPRDSRWALAVLK